jgi:hypothetical protein
MLLEVTPYEIVLRGEVAEERPSPDARRLGDVVDRGRLEPVPGEQIEGQPFQGGPRGHPRSAHDRLGAALPAFGGHRHQVATILATPMAAVMATSTAG